MYRIRCHICTEYVIRSSFITATCRKCREVQMNKASKKFRNKKQVPLSKWEWKHKIT